MKKLLQIVLIGLLTLSCNSKNKTEANTIYELELANFNQDDQTKKLEYLKSNIFNGLKNLNDGFDSESIYYFSESDFEIVLDRVEKNGLGIHGIEPWLNGDFYDVAVVEDFKTVSTDPSWYRKAFSDFKKSGKELMYAASYEVPKQLLAE